jgi:hypothetical protein
MPRSNRIFKKRKGGPGRTKKSSVNTANNLYSNENSVNNVSSVSGCCESSFRLGVSYVSTPSANSSSASSINNSSAFSASRRKLFCIDASVNGERLTSGNVVVDVSLLSAAVCSFVRCKFCHAHNSIIHFEDTKARFEFASK